MLLSAEGRPRSAPAAVPKEHRALLHYSAAAEMGYAIAMANAAWMLDRFLGPSAVSGRHGRAREYNERALYEGHRHLHLPLGDYHYYGRGALDPPEAGGTGEGPDKARALEHYRAASEAGVRQASFNLAQMYHGGDGVGRNLSRARELYRLAAGDGGADAGQIFSSWLVRVALAQLWAQERLQAAATRAGLGRLPSDTALLAALAAALAVLLALRSARRRRGGRGRRAARGPPPGAGPPAAAQG
eukprot:tig00020801_g13972.t1